MRRAEASVVIAPDKFKGCLTAPEVAACLAVGMRETSSRLVLHELPVADGGDGTLAVLARAGYALETVDVEGPLGAPVTAHLAVRGDVAAVEIAETSGLSALAGGARDPMRASSYGLGEAIGAALDRGCREVIVALGGSAGTDGGAGMMQALGAQFLDAAGRPIPRGGAGLQQLRRIDLDPALRRLAGVRLVAACDVTNPLLGPNGTARVYGPQKGSTAVQAAELDAWLAALVVLMERSGALRVAEAPGAGAAGGVGYALLAVGARFRRGADLVLDVLGVPARIATADLVVTGEGALDEQTLHGKAPYAVAAAGRRHGVPVVAAVGRTSLSDAASRTAGFAQVYALADSGRDPTANAVVLLRGLGARIASDWIG